MHINRIIIIIVFIQICGLLQASVWQYSVKVGDTNNIAYLYIPPACNEIRTALIALDNVLERPLMEDIYIRRLAAEENMALIWIGADEQGKRVFNSGIDYSKGEDRLFDRMINDLAIESGYTEIKDIPVITLGHSAGVHFACGVGYYKPEKTAAIIALKTNIPAPPKDAPNDNLYGIPFLIVKGQYSEWLGKENVNQEGSWYGQRKYTLKLRTESQENLISYLLDVGDGHFSGNDDLYRALALYIRKVIQYRIPEKVGQPLKPIQTSSGYLTDSGIAIEKVPEQINPYAKFKGSKEDTFWYLDKELATHFRKYGHQYKDKKRQLTTFADGGHTLPWGGRGPVDLVFKPQEDGRTFKLYGTFLDTIPARLVNGNIPIGHADPPVQVCLIRGPVQQLDEHTFRLSFDRSGFSRRGCDAWFLASHPGNESYARSVFPGEIMFKPENTEGEEQVITFDPISDQPVTTKELLLEGSVSSGLPVEYYIKTGPVELVGNKLIFTEIPPRSAFPVKVTVVAYQWGRSIAPHYKSATPREQSFYIYK